ncbi:hypothetical protein L1987_07873 [Smallanthus sonchifolius]|uniref:Uncharacterized protein n=1 Tax=Smallanthus sonchifolius TaxID=185202 RepID=A0ACB9JIL4_9ASTR|nr:hypothetical protein L1987_07873 [Smallanthus sonchifolius]
MLQRNTRNQFTNQINQEDESIIIANVNKDVKTELTLHHHHTNNSRSATTTPADFGSKKMGSTARILTLSLYSPTTTRFSYSLITFPKFHPPPRKLYQVFRPLSTAAAAAAPITDEPSLES